MRILLDTNILIHREAQTVIREDIGQLFRWIDKLNLEKVVHPGSIEELRKHADPNVVRSIEIKVGSYQILKTLASPSSKIEAIMREDITPNDVLDTALLCELVAGRVGALITEDRGIHRKAAALEVATSVFTIDAFLEKVTSENPDLSEYKVLSVRKCLLGKIDLGNAFFDSFRSDYPGFDGWFNRKADENAYTCVDDNGQIVAFLYLKREGPGENYSDITPQFAPRTRLKIGTMKVISNGYKLGERFLKIAIDNALRFEVDEIYVTIYRRTPEQDRLYRFLEDWGFVKHGTKISAGGQEEVLVRNFKPHVNLVDPRYSYPYISSAVKKFIVPIYPNYHTELLPDSILNTESPDDFIESRPNRNAISKVYISRSIERGLSPGDIIVFYRTKADSAPAHHTSVATTLGVVQEVFANPRDLDDFLRICRKRSVFTDEELRKHWEWKRHNRPFVVNFLFIHSFPRRPNLKELKEKGVIAEAPRGFEPLTDTAFTTLLEIAGANKRLVVH